MGDGRKQDSRTQTSMLTDRTHQPFAVDDADPTSDRAMLVLQYLTAVIAVIAAALLALVH
jgi:hypothetical protein